MKNMMEYLTRNQNSLDVIVIKIIVILVLTLLIQKIVNKIFYIKIKDKIDYSKYVKYNQNKLKTVLSILKNTISVLIYFVSITFILNIFNIDTKSILAVAGIGGMAVAFAAKSLIEDVIKGAFILIEDQFNIGDLVEIDGKTGTVTFMGIRVTKLKDIDGREIIVPNGQISTVINYSINEMRAAVKINISSFKDIDFVKGVIEKACLESFETFEYFTKQPVIIGVEEITDYTYKFLVEGQTKTGQQWEAERHMRYIFIKYLQKNNISFSSIKVE